MSISTSPRPSAVDRRARGATAALFLTNGVVVANILPRLPEVKASLGLDNTAYGLAVAALPAGAVLAGTTAAPLIRRFGSGAVAVVGTILAAAAILGAGMAGTVTLFAAMFLLTGAADAVTDVAQNSHGLCVQRRYGRSIINSFHAVWSVGAVLGGLMAAGAIALSVPLGLHLAISSALVVLVALLASRACLPHSETAREPGETGPPVSEVVHSVGHTGHAGHAGQSGHAGSTSPGSGVLAPGLLLRLAALVLIASAGSVAEDSANSWAALYLSDSLGAAGSVAAAGFIALMSAQFVGRVVGDRMVDRWGQRAVARAGGLITATGMGAALAFPSVPGTIAGFAAAGFGVATLVPAAMHAADHLPGLRPGTGLAVVTWLMRFGFLLPPPVVGWVADRASLRVGLLAVPLAGAVVVMLAGVLAGRSRPSGSGTHIDASAEDTG